MIDAAAVERATGWTVHHHPVVASTNDEALALIAAERRPARVGRRRARRCKDELVSPVPGGDRGRIANVSFVGSQALAEQLRDGDRCVL